MALTLREYCSLLLFFILFVGAFPVCVARTALRNSPEEYFGSTENESYLEWAETYSLNYQASIFLPSDTDAAAGVALHWDIRDETLYLALAARATGWLGFGLSENGGMFGSDLLLFEAEKPKTIIDAYVLDDPIPLTDNCQNWELVASHTDSEEFIIVEVKRLLDTGDNQDRKIFNDESLLVPPHRVIAAWGDKETVLYHGANRARGSVRWYGFGSDAAEKMFEESVKNKADGHFDIVARNYRIRPVDTKYKRFCISQSQLEQAGVPVESGVTIIGFEPIISAGSEPFVHHFTVHGSVSDNNDAARCRDYDKADDLVYAWAPGVEASGLPSNVGLNVKPGRNRSFRLVTHYNNPERVDGVIDNSGVRFYYSLQPREYEMGLLQLGDPLLRLIGEHVGTDLMEHTFVCPSSCSGLALGGEPITVFAEFLHMHGDGVTASNELIRDSEVVHTGRVDFFDFYQQGNQAVQENGNPGYVVQPGDSFRTTCSYKSNGRTVFGPSSQNEMCIAFIRYYPRKEYFFWYPWTCGVKIPMLGCEATHETKSLESVKRAFGKAGETCKKVP